MNECLTLAKKNHLVKPVLEWMLFQMTSACAYSSTVQAVLFGC